MTKAELRTAPVERERTASSVLPLIGLLVLGLVIRLLFIGNQGFKVDLDTFEAWSGALATHPFSQFYKPNMFADYPPGYFYILAVVGHIFALVSPNGNYDILRVMVKLPAVLMDLVDGLLLFAIVRRFASERWALGVAAFFLLNPAVIFNSAAWGQVDSISAGLALVAFYLLLRSNESTAPLSWQIILAWLALGYSLLIKPQAAILVPLFVAFAFTSRERLTARVASTAIGGAAALVLAWLVALPFHPVASPVAVYAWLYHQYSVGKNVYAYNSVNAFNLWAVRYPFWQPDSNAIAGLPQYTWGIVLTCAAAVLVVVRYLQVRTEQSLLEGAALLTLAFFILTTRMHERYIYDGLIFTIAAMPFAVRYTVSAAVFSVTLFINLMYSLTYLTVVTQSTPGVNAADMWWPVPHLLAVVNVAAFFYLGYAYLGERREAAPVREWATAAWMRARSWFDPREGLARMVWPLDYVLAGSFGLISFVLSYVNYWLPTEKVFDEIYFARAAEEYLTHKYIYENTHPPLTKLIITLSTMLFGGMPAGDNSHGWRFLDVVFGAIVIVVLYAFAKRLTRSTLFASIAAALFICDGMHFVQSRIATPEGIVIVFSLGTLYAFYRFWIASQATIRTYQPGTIARAAISAIAALVIGFAISAAIMFPLQQSFAAFVTVGVYLSVGLYLLMRLWIVPRLMPPQGEFATYPEGAMLVQTGAKGALETPDGRTMDAARKNALTYEDGGLRIDYARGGRVTYATPAGSATYAPGVIEQDGQTAQEGRHATGWLIAFTLLLGALVASKWYGVMAYGVSFVVIAFVWLQRYWAANRPKRWGNPYGFRLDIAIATVIFLSMTVYLAVWIPDFFRQIEIKNFTDLVYRQYSMYEYHATLKATHPYASKWWTWPLDLRPIAYYWKDTRTGLDATRAGACCVSEIISLPNPLIMWFGLICVPLVALLAWYEKNKGYGLLIVAYLLQWLPWALSPRLAWIYHFYVNVPIIVLCNVIVLQRIWQWGTFNKDAMLFSRIGVAAYVVAVAGAFVFFYPVLAGVPVPWDAWNARMWLGAHWV